LKLNTQTLKVFSFLLSISGLIVFASSQAQANEQLFLATNSTDTKNKTAEIAKGQQSAEPQVAEEAKNSNENLNKTTTNSASPAAQSNSLSSTDKSLNSTSDAAKKSALKSGVSQGLSLRESMTLNQTNPWSHSVNTFTYRSLDYYDDTYWAIGGDIAYKIKNNQSIAASIQYYETTDRLDEDPGRYGVSDLDVAWLLPFIWKNPKYGNLSASFTLTAPLSESSKRQSFVGGLTSSLSMRKPLSGSWSFLTLAGFTSLTLNHFTYDKTDVFGSDINSPVGVTVGLSATAQVMSQLFWTNSLSLYERIDYAGDWRTIQTVSSSLSLLIKQNLNIFGQYRWRDQVVTNDAFLDDDKSRVTIGGSFFF
jgi:hypothetical protein